MKSAKTKDKIEEIEKYLDEMSSIIPSDLHTYLHNFEKKAACERYFEKIIEAVVDMAFLIIKDRGFEMPEEDKEAFDILAKEKIISLELSEKLKDAKGMRNIISHQYGNVDDEIVFKSITQEIEQDVEEFIKNIKIISRKNEKNKKP